MANWFGVLNGFGMTNGFGVANGFGVVRWATMRPDRAGVENIDDARGDAASGKSLAREEKEGYTTELLTIRPRSFKRMD